MQFDVLKDFVEPSVDEENKIAPIANELYNRIAEETERLLRGQLLLVGIDMDDITLPNILVPGVKYTAFIKKVRKIVYPDDDLALATYEYDGKKILGVRISENRMAIEFDVVSLTKETQKGEVQNETVQE